MIANIDLGILLVEFDSLKGPIIRKQQATNNQLLKMNFKEEFLMWILRATDFSIKKFNDQVIYAKSIELSDPNFQRKKRQFGLALISDNSLTITKAENLLNDLIQNCKERSDNQSYFRMLNGLLTTINSQDFTLQKVALMEGRKESKIAAKVIDEENCEDENSADIIGEIPHLLISNKLQLINVAEIRTAEPKITVLIGHPEAYEDNSKGKKKLSQTFENIEICIELQDKIPEGIYEGLTILAKILNAKENIEDITDRILVGIEFLDRLLLENVDIEYYLPFLQYFIAMENYTLSEFDEEEYTSQLPNLSETHGEWISAILGKKIKGEKLSKFFALTGNKREGLELLIDLLFIKIIAIF
ncbi:MAG: hypothetical protein ACFFDW_08235 [Candidatus Thorarchaeota archaeon]